MLMSCSFPLACSVLIVLRYSRSILSLTAHYRRKLRGYVCGIVGVLSNLFPSCALLSLVIMKSVYLYVLI